MEHFKIKTYKQSRVIFLLLLSPVILFSGMFLGIETSSIILSLSIYVIFCFFSYYYVVGYIEVIIDNQELYFKWKQKPLFSKELDPSIKIRDIKTLVLDGNVLRKIKTQNEVVLINNSNIDKTDAFKFIKRLKRIISIDTEIIDSWDDFARSGNLRIVYRINSLLLILAVSSIIIVSITVGVKPILFSLLILFIPQFILYQKQIKYKLKKQSL
ncbi:MAG: hypothetical protein QM710_05905 [Flavobacterium sp.]